MDIFYTDDTLYVNFSRINSGNDIIKLKKRVFKILEDYSIDNVVLNIVTDDNISKEMIDSFINEYNNRFNGKIIMKK
ncbi:MAG: hypothetical protein ACI31M_03925 [Bacilli bacterium]